jgi:hypothetical protein
MGDTKVGLLGWNNCGVIRWAAMDMNENADNAWLKEKMNTVLEKVSEMNGGRVPSPFEFAWYLGNNGGPLSPMETALALMMGWAEAEGLNSFGQHRLTDGGVLSLVTFLRDILGGLYLGARERPPDQASPFDEELRRIPKSKRF